MKNNFRIKILTGIFAIQFAFSLVVLFVYIIICRNSLIEGYGNEASKLAYSISNMLDADTIYDYALEKTADETYYDIKDTLVSIKDNFNEIRYLCIFVPISKDELIYVYDIYGNNELNSNSNNNKKLGTVEPFDDSIFPGAKNIYETDSDYPVIVKSKSIYGNLISAYAPILEPKGHVKAIVSVDFDMEYVSTSLYKKTCQVAVIILILWLIICFIEYLYFEIFVLDFFDIIFDNFIELKKKFKLKNDEEENKIVSINNFVPELVDIFELAENSYDENLMLKKANDEYEKNIAFTSMIQLDLFDKTLIRNFENEYFNAYGNIYAQNEFLGNFYDCFEIDDFRYVFIYGNVMERNMAAAFYMLTIKELLRNRSYLAMELNDILDVVNNQLAVGNDAAVFIKCFIGLYDAKKRKFSYSIAAANEPLLIKEDGQIVSLEQSKKYMPLAVWEDTVYELSDISINPSDCLVMFNHDIYQILEKANLNKKDLVDIILKYRKKNEKNLVESVIEELKAVAGNADNSLEYSLLLVDFI